MTLPRVRVTASSTFNCIRQNTYPSISHSIACQPHFTQHQPVFPLYQRKRLRIDPPSYPSARSFTTSTHRLDSSSSNTSPSIPWPTHPNPTPYEIFALPRTANQKEIKSRYFQLVKHYHPDHAPRSSVDRFRKVVDAYKILSHPSKRLEWDRQHPPREPTAHTSTPTASQFRQPWSGSRLSRRRTEAKGPPPSGGWSFHKSAGRVRIN